MDRTSINQPPPPPATGAEAAHAAAEALGITRHCEAEWERPDAGKPWVIAFHEPVENHGISVEVGEPFARASVARDGTVTRL